MPKWIHDRADHLMAKNPEMSKSMAFAIATDQHKKLEKNAEAQVEQEERPNLRKFLKGWAGDVGGRLLGGDLGLSASTRAAEEVAANPGLADALKQRLREDAADVRFRDAPFPGANFFVMDSGAATRAYGLNAEVGDVIVDPHASPGFMAHELGHSDVAKHPLGKVIQNPFTLALGNLSRGVGFVSGGLSGMSDDPTMQTLGVAAPAVAAAPQLVYEAAASLLGLRRLRRAGASADQLVDAAKQLGLAFGTYGARAASGAGLALSTQGMVGGIRNALEEPDAVPEEKVGALADDIRSALEGQTVGPVDRLKSSIRSEALTLSENPMPTKYLATKITGGMPLSKIGHVEFNAFIDELIKDAEDLLAGGLGDKKKPSDFDKGQLQEGAKHELEHTDNKALAREIAMDHLTEDPRYYDKISSTQPLPAAPPTRFQKFVSGMKGEAGPAVGATLGAGLAKAYGIDPLAGAAAGYGIGAIPEVVHALTHKIAATDEELRETGRQRAVTSLAADAHRDAGRRGERAGGAVGALGGAVGGAALGRKLIGGAPGTIAGLVGGYVAGSRVGKEVGSELDIRKNAFALSPFAGQPAQNPPGMRLASPAPPVTVPALAVKEAFQTSQYSGPLSQGGFKMTSGIPPFKSPAMTKVEPTAEQPWMTGGEKTGGIRERLLRLAERRGEKIAGGMNTALDSMGPAGRLTQTQRVGAPKTTGVAGPSIADIAKPTGFGKPMAGATKSF